MSAKLNPYLSFRDKTREAMKFYQSVFGGKLDLHTFKEYQASKDPKEDDKIMHAQLETDNGIIFMAADTPNGMEYKPGANVSMSISGDDEEELTGYFEKLSSGAKITMPLAKAVWGDTFGMLTDRYGIHWMVNIAGKKS